MTTITRYSSQLEAAQARIETLEADLLRQERGVTDELVISLAQELRTPMTSIAGYTDLLLSEMLGALGAKQRDFLQRVKANVERMDAFLDLIVQLTTSGERNPGAESGGVDIQVSIDTAVSNVITQIREKAAPGPGYLTQTTNTAHPPRSAATNHQQPHRQCLPGHPTKRACRRKRLHQHPTASRQQRPLRTDHLSASGLQRQRRRHSG